MALYLVQHTHTAETCPARDPEMVQQLASHVSQTNADRYGVRIVADWVYEPEHTMLMILETDSPEKAANFAMPFLSVGSITIKAGQTCEEVAEQMLSRVAAQEPDVSL